MSRFNDGFKFGLGLFSAILICGVAVLIIAFAFNVLISKKKYTNDTGVQLVSVKHWLAKDKLIFAGKVTYEGPIKWKDIELSFVINDDQGKFIGRCQDNLFHAFEFDKTLEFRATCYDIPPDFKLKNYKFESSGTY